MPVRRGVDKLPRHAHPLSPSRRPVARRPRGGARRDRPARARRGPRHAARRQRRPLLHPARRVRLLRAARDPTGSRPTTRRRTSGPTASRRGLGAAPARTGVHVAYWSAADERHRLRRPERRHEDPQARGTPSPLAARPSRPTAGGWPTRAGRPRLRRAGRRLGPDRPSSAAPTTAPGGPGLGLRRLGDRRLRGGACPATATCTRSTRPPAPAIR